MEMLGVLVDGTTGAGKRRAIIRAQTSANAGIFDFERIM